MAKPAARSTRASRPTLPEPPTTFFGRERELDALAAAIAEGRRVVTVLGPGGVGKTRLVLRFASLVARAEGASRLDIVFCDLTEAASLADLVASLARALGAKLPSSDEAGALLHLGGALAARIPTLLVLDNIEQIVDDVASSMAQLVARAPELRVLCTSRVRLRVTGEIVVDLEPLAVPDPRDAAPERFSAVQLFNERARQIAPGWGTAPGDTAIVAGLVRRLDGFPLAIELCASRSRVLEPAALLRRLEGGLDALGAGPRDVAARHSTLAHAIDWSVRTLPGPPRSAFEQCAVFAGGFTLEAAEAIVDLGGASVLDALSHLVDVSLLRAVAGRFAMYSAIRDHAARDLAASGGAAAVEARHARWFVELGETLLREAPDRERPRLLLERDNLVAVHARAVARRSGRVDSPVGHGDPGWAELGLRAALVLDDLLEGSGSFRELFERVDAALADAESRGASPALVAQGLWVRGRARLIPHTPEAVTDLERAVAMATACGDRVTEARACASLGVAYRMLRRMEDARATGERSVAVARAIGASRVEGRARNALGGLLYEMGDRERAGAMLAQAEAIARRVGDPWIEALTVAGQAHLLHEQGDLAGALRTFERASALFEANEDARDAAVCAGYLACVRHEQGDRQAARLGYDGVAERLARLGNPRFEGLFLACSGAASAELGRTDEARAAFDAAARILHQLGDPALVLALELHRLHLALATPSGASEALARSNALTDPSPLVAQSDDVRFALRILHRAIADARRGGAGPALRLALASRWFEPPGGRRTALGRKRALWLILHALADARLRAPGQVMSSESLVAAGWPDERILPTAGAHRVRVAVATLRNSGLRGILLSRSGGYVLDPVARVELLSD